MAEKFQILSASKGVQVIAQNEKYYFSSKLFSHSSSLTDSEGKIVGSLKRSSWWRMKFDLNVDGKNYQLKQGALTTEIFCQETGTHFSDLGGGDFFKKNTRVTQHREQKNTNSKGSHYMISDDNHCLALLMAICLGCNPHLNDSGYL